jgi:ribulose-phosphate 3-epimerase
MAEIVPAILPKSYDELVEQLDISAGHVHAVQIDICDGGYAPTRTWPYLKGPNVEDTIFNDIVSQEKALPHWEDIDFEFDLMVNDPYDKIPDYISAGATRIIIHRGSVDDTELASIIKDYGKHSEELGPFDVELGIALKPSESPDLIKDIADKIHFIQVMGSDNIGFHGEVLSNNAVELIKVLRAEYPDMPISIDIGVNLEIAPRLLEAGATRLVVGSALFDTPDFLGTLEEFRAL